MSLDNSIIEVSLLAHEIAKKRIFSKILNDSEMTTDLLNELLNGSLEMGDYEYIPVKTDSKKNSTNNFAAFIIGNAFVFIEVLNDFGDPETEVKNFMEILTETLFKLINYNKVALSDVPDLTYEFFMIYTGEKKIKKSYSLSQGSACTFTIKVIDDREELALNKVARHYYDFCKVHLEESRGNLPPEIVAENAYKRCVRWRFPPKFFANRRIIEDMIVDLSPYELENDEGFRDELKIWMENDMIDEVASTAIINVCKDLKHTDDEIIEDLMRHMSLSKDSAKAFFDRYNEKHPSESSD